VIIGAGAVGSLSTIAALSVGAVPVMLDIADSKLRLTTAYGARFTVKTPTEDAQARVREITHGRMANAVMKISAANEAVVSTTGYVANAGRIILTRWAKSPLMLDTRLITRKEVDALGQRNTDLAEISERLMPAPLTLCPSSRVPSVSIKCRGLSRTWLSIRRKTSRQWPHSEWVRRGRG